ncbi:hypothetical protein, partial [Hymenobacter sp. 15J16-1T3B]|uniref:hypothetical protein n=1 Tax=Hymenobacter sp. 15J16-1T3B TaxID=2886941 RepID=UPI001D101B8D
MNIPKIIIQQEGPPVLQLFCYIYIEIKKELDEVHGVSDRAFELSEQFKESYLQPDSSLFNKDSFADTIGILKNVLQDIDIKTVYKDADFWHFYDAVEAFLYGERDSCSDGIYWGINNFYDVWEDMCQTYVLQSADFKENVLYADIQGRLVDYGKMSSNPFLLSFNNSWRRRELRPDLVTLTGIGYNTAAALYNKVKKVVDNESYYTIRWLDYERTMSEYPEVNSIFRKYMQRNRKFIENQLCKGIVEIDINSFDNEINSIVAKRPVVAQPSGSYVLSGDNISIIKIVDYKYMHQMDYEEYSPYRIDNMGQNKIKEDI